VTCVVEADPVREVVQRTTCDVSSTSDVTVRVTSAVRMNYVSIQQQPHTFNELILVLQNVSLPHLVKEFPAVEGNQGSLLCSQTPPRVPILSQMNRPLPHSLFQ
jgi:hypothetical protein